MNSDASARLLDGLTAIATRASAAILAIDRSALGERSKADGSPVTAADQAAQAVILPELVRLMPGTPIVSEEAEKAPLRPGESYLLVDPIDGTKELLAGCNEFTVNLALVRDGLPVLGVVAAPALGVVWRGIVGHGAERLRFDEAPVAIHSRMRHVPLIAAVSRSHPDPATDAFLARQPEVERVACGSALKFCRLAEGAADIYPRLAPTHEWDIAAGHALLAAAGGAVTTPSGDPLTYGREGFRIPAFIAWGDPRAISRKAVLQS
jgi:3'(2'), 5'-bisphosphate nucleotidase